MEKQDILDDIKALIEASDNLDYRIEGLSKLKNLDKSITENVFNFLENLLISESNSQIRQISAKIIREKFLEKAFKPMRWSLEHDEDPVVFREAYYSLIKYFGDIGKFGISNVKEYLKNIILTLKKNQFNITFQDYYRHIPDKELSVDHLSSILMNYFTLIYLEKKYWRLKYELRNCKVIKLDFLFKGLTDLDISMKNLKSLKSLILRYNQLKEIPKWIGDFEDLEHLNLNINNIERIPNTIGNLKSLKQFLLWKNELTILPKEICELNNLEVFNLRLNSLKSLPEKIDRLEKLIDFNLHDNKLSELPKSICNLYNLKNLNLSWNEIESLPDCIGNLRSLVVLDLERNKLENIPNTIGNLKNLQHLNLSENKLIEIPESINKLSNLKTLNISRNNLTKLPESLSKLKNLKDLYISDNNLENEQSIIKGLKLNKTNIYSDY